MVYSRTKLMMEDYIFGNEMEHKKINMNYEGKNPIPIVR